MLSLLDARIDVADAPTPADAPVDAASNSFIDPFTRADNPNLGNGWIEKTPGTFSITNDEVVRVDTTITYRDNMVYRPASEDLRDIEVSIRVRFNQTPPRYPQIFVRARSASIAQPDNYDGYLLYVDGSTAMDVVLGRQLGTVFVVALSRFTLSEPLGTAVPYRLTLRAIGSAPVLLEARVEKLGGTPVLIGSTTFQDSAANRITEAGTVGFAGDEIAAYAYDDFVRTAL